tara:strand:+ start:1519 stop:2640 length:1122 start_codon:yes stop_codon:yes gene_type:complete
MSVPLISSVAFTEVDSAGTLNEKAGTTKSKLPVQFFRLTSNITGNLTMTDDSAHKKIILDTNGNNIINSSGSPITNNSSTTINLKGNGEVKSELLTFTSEVTDTSNTGTTTISAADNSTVVVSSVTRDADITSTGVSCAQGFRGSFSSSTTHYVPNSEIITAPSNPGSNTGSLSGGASTTASQFATICGTSFENIDASGFSITLSGSGLGPTTFTSPTSTSSNSRNFVLGTVSQGSETFTMGVQIVKRSNTDIRINSLVDLNTLGASTSLDPTITNITIPNNTVAGGGRTIAFTNNLAISCVLSGADPFDGVTVAAGATNTQTRSTTDGSFSLTGTISGSDGSSRPFAMKDINDGSGSLDETEYTGTKSVSAF